MRIDRHTWRAWRSERGSQGIPAAGAALAAALIVLALLGAAPRVGVAVERAFRCAAAALSGGAGCASGNTTSAASTGMSTYQAARKAPADDSAMPDQMRAFFDAILSGNAGEFLKQLGGFFKGFWEGGVDFLRGFGDLAKDLWGLVSGDPEVRQKYATLIEAFRADPPGMLKAMGQAVIAPVVEDWQAGRQGEAIGRLTFEVVSAVVGDKGVGKLAKLGKVEEVLGASGRNADEIAELTRRANRIPCIGYGAPKGKGPGLAAPLADPGCSQIRNLFSQRFAGKPGVDDVLKELDIPGSRAQGADWQVRYALKHLDPDEVIGFEQPGTKGRVDIVLSQGGRVTFLEAKRINWYALAQKQREGQAAERIVEQVLGHAEGKKAFSKVVIESTGQTPDWFVKILEQEGIQVEVFTP